MSEKVNLQKIMTNSITQDEWPHLQMIAKMLHEHVIRCSKNREYAQAQKTKQKIGQLNQNIKKRNAHFISEKFQENIMKIQAKQIIQKDNFMMEWQSKISTIEKSFQEGYIKRDKLNEEERIKLRDQLQMALPTHASPDDKLKQLRHQQKKYANQGNFIEAQKTKQLIQEREMTLQQRHNKLRENNIDSMIQQLEQKQTRDLQDRQRQRKHVVEQMLKQRNKKLRDIDQRHFKQMKQMKWMFNQEIKMATGHH